MIPGTFEAENHQLMQYFPVPRPLVIRYLKVLFLSFYGRGPYCTVSTRHPEFPDTHRLCFSQTALQERDTYHWSREPPPQGGGGAGQNLRGGGVGPKVRKSDQSKGSGFLWHFFVILWRKINRKSKWPPSPWGGGWLDFAREWPQKSEKWPHIGKQLQGGGERWRGAWNCGVRAQYHNDTSILFLILNPRAFSPSLTAAQQSSIIYLHEFLAEEWPEIGCRIRQLGTREQAPPAAFDIPQLFWPFWIDRSFHTWPTEYWHNAALCRQARFGSMVPHQAGLAQTMAHIHVFFPRIIISASAKDFLASPHVSDGNCKTP